MYSNVLSEFVCQSLVNRLLTALAHPLWHGRHHRILRGTAGNATVSEQKGRPSKHARSVEADKNERQDGTYSLLDVLKGREVASTLGTHGARRLVVPLRRAQEVAAVPPGRPARRTGAQN